MDAAKETALAQFMAVTGAPADEAAFHLESAAWNAEAAMTNYFENSGASGASSNGSPAPLQAAPSAAAAASSSSSSSGGGGSTGGARIRTFQDMARGGGSDSDEDSDRPQNFFAGGEKSGVMVEGGPKEKKGGAALDLVKEIMSKAAKAGPAPGDDTEQKKPSNVFSGSGYRLGSEDEPATAGPSQPTVSVPPPVVDPSTQSVERHLTFWQDGFSIDDGPLREYEDPANQEFLRAIKSGRAPTSLLNVAYGQPVEVKVSHRMQEKYQPPAKKPMAAFAGSGQRLGGVVPGDAPAAGSSSEPMSLPGAFPGAASAPARQATSPASTVAAPSASVAVDFNLPVTSIQIRLGDGTRLVAKFNHGHTVGDLVGFVHASRPGSSARPFVLQTTFPVKELTDHAATIKDAGLLNAVVVQKYV
ncbi:hypothetical protein BC831DRAFT_516360 [Entophlyctis helioformis]|nr:hypothetical protein BC831DRAFT_516360 [Entophlyctis helioformis]